MIQPGNFDIVIQQGADWLKTFQFFDSDNDPLNMTDWEVAAEIWTEGKRAKLADFTFEWVNASIGKFNLSLSEALTFTIPESGYYDVKVTNSDGFTNYWVRGRAILEVGYTE